MNCFRKNGIEIKIVTCFLSFLMVSQGVTALAGSDRIIPTHKVTLYRGDQIVGEYTQEAPLPQGSFIATDGRCAVKLEDLYLVAEDKSVFSINTSGRQRNLFVKQGTVYFKTSEMMRALAFVTPDGQISVQRIRLNAAFGDQSINGYVAVTQNQSEFGVAEGGSMDVFTDDGLMTIQAGKKIILAQADMDIGLPKSEEKTVEPPPEPAKGGMSSRKKIAYGALGAAAIAAIALGFGGGGGGGDGGGGTVSPSTP